MIYKGRKEVPEAVASQLAMAAAIGNSGGSGSKNENYSGHMVGFFGGKDDTATFYVFTKVLA